MTALYKQQEFVKYSITMTSYGYYGDLLADSERFRVMGPKRYKWSGAYIKYFQCAVIAAGTLGLLSQSQGKASYC